MNSLIRLFPRSRSRCWSLGSIRSITTNSASSPVCRLAFLLRNDGLTHWLSQRSTSQTQRIRSSISHSKIGEFSPLRSISQTQRLDRLFRKTDPEQIVLYLYRNSPSVIIGRNQVSRSLFEKLVATEFKFRRTPGRKSISQDCKSWIFPSYGENLVEVQSITSVYPDSSENEF